MTDITKRLAEALRKRMRSGHDKVLKEASEVLADFDRTAAQEANVQEGELCVLAKDVMAESQVMETLSKSAKYSADERKTYAWCARELNMMATQTNLRTAAPHLTPAPASGEVTGIATRIVGLLWATPLTRIDAYKRTVAILEAATRARQGECVTWEIADKARKDFERIRKTKNDTNAMMDALHNAQSQAGTVAAPNAADTEAYLAVTLEDATKAASAYADDIGCQFYGKDDIDRMLHIFQSIGCVIPTAAPVPADEGEK